MNIPHYAIKRRVTTVMVFLCIVFLGIISWSSLPRELFPQISFPQITVLTEYVNAAPEEIETLITRPLEEAISSVSGLRKLESISKEGESKIFVSFGWNENIDFAALRVREKIDLVKERLPKESEDSVVLKFDPLARPTMILSVTGETPSSELKALSERILKENLEKVEGVASVSISGGLDREIQVDLSQSGLQSAQVSILDVIDAVDTANISYPAGSVKKGLYEYIIRTVGEFRSVPEIGYTVVKTDVKKQVERQASTFLEKGESGTRSTLDRLREEGARGVGEKRLVMLRDIGEVTDGFHERTAFSRYNGEENISISIRKQGSANTVEVAERIKHEVMFLQDELETRGISVTTIYDHSKFIKKSIEDIQNAAIQGGLIAMLILFFFFREWVSSLVVALGIPVSLIGTFFFFQLQGVSLNMMSLAGLALAAGFTVDNGIVVVENIFRLREQGHSHTEASIKGANEVFWPLFSSNLTTVAVFFPLILFVPGIAGQLFKDLSWAIVYCSAISFLASVWLTPMLALYIQNPPKKDESSEKTKMFGVQIKNAVLAMGRAEQNRLCRWVVAAGLISFFVGLLIFRFLDTEVLPKVDQGQFLIRVNLPVGSRLEATDEVVRAIEKETRGVNEVESVSVTVGSSRTSKAGEVKIETLGSHQGLILVSLKKKRKHSSSAVVAELKERIEKYNFQKAQVEYVLQESEFEFAAQGGKPITIEIKGYDLQTLSKLTRKIERLITSISGTTEIINDQGEPSPETKVEIDRKKAALYGISARDISLTAKAAIEGAIATKYKEEGREFDVRIRLREEDRKDIRKVGDLLVYSKVLEVPVPLKEVGTIKQGYGPSEIRRKDQIRTVMVTGQVAHGFKENSVLAKIESVLRSMEIPPDYTVDLVGKRQEVRESFRRLTFAIILALILVYMIMAAQFESFSHPFIVMIAVPLALIGVALALFVTGTALSIISLLGILMLAGTAVNNAIVLIDFINETRRAGGELVASCIEASIVRFRAIVSSALTSVGGLIPLALGLGEGAELQSPLAIAIIGGTVSSTVFTLVVIPALYILITRAIDRLLNAEDLGVEPA